MDSRVVAMAVGVVRRSASGADVEIAIKRLTEGVMVLLSQGYLENHDIAIVGAISAYVNKCGRKFRL